MGLRVCIAGWIGKQFTCVPHDHKQVDSELDNYPIALRQGITTLYLRKI